MIDPLPDELHRTVRACKPDASARIVDERAEATATEQRACAEVAVRPAAETGPCQGGARLAPAWVHRLCDVLTGLTLLAWSAGWTFAAIRQPNWVVSTMALFQAWVGALLVVRSPVTTPGRWTDAVLAAPALLLSGLALKLAPAPSTWPTWYTALFVTAAAWSLISLAWLGRSFAIFPAARPLVAGGPYRFVRHPAYAGEFAMVVACVLAGGMWTLLLLPAAAAALVVRIRAEESTLGAQADYRQYAKLVRWRLLPYVW